MIKFYIDNLIDQATLYPSTENKQFPAKNLKHPFRTKVFRTIGNAGYIIIDFMETSDIDSIILVDVPGQGFGLSSLVLELGHSNDFSTPGFSIPVEFDQKWGIAFAEFELQSFRFARLVMESSLPYCELPKLFLGQKTEFQDGTGIDLGWTYKSDDQSVIKANSVGQEFVDLKPRRRQLGYSLSALNKDEHDQIIAIDDKKGTTGHFFVRLGNDEMSNEPNRYSGMFKLTTEPSVPNIAFGLYNMSMTVKEAM